MSTPREIFEQLIDGMTNKKWDQLPELFAEDVVIFHPLSTGPEARIEGRERVREFSRALPLSTPIYVSRTSSYTRRPIRKS
jgi:hypothetical protein